MKNALKKRRDTPEVDSGVRVEIDDTPAETWEIPQKKLPGKVAMAIAVVMASVIVAAALIYSVHTKKPVEDGPEIITVSSLEKIVQDSKLSTVSFMHNGVAEVHNEKKPEEVDYYVSYKAEVRIAIDFSEVGLREDPIRKIIFVTLPDPDISEISVDIASLDYIFQNEKANSVTVTQTAYESCLDDAMKECESNEDIFSTAELNAKNALRGLSEPIIEEFFEGYRLEFEDEIAEEGGEES